MLNVIYSFYFYLWLFVAVLTFFFKYGITSCTAGMHGRLQKLCLHIMKKSRAQVTVLGMENLPEAPVLFIANHQSYFDAVLLMAYLPHPPGFFAKIEVLKIPFIKKLSNKLNMLFLDRGNLRQNVRIIHEGIDQLKNGHSLAIVPEGTWEWEREGKMLPFKRGSFKLATESGVPIVPISIVNAHKITPRGSFILRPAAVKLMIHPPVMTAGLSRAETATLADQVKQIIERELDNEKPTSASTKRTRGRKSKK